MAVHFDEICVRASRDTPASHPWIVLIYDERLQQSGSDSFWTYFPILGENLEVFDRKQIIAIGRG